MTQLWHEFRRMGVARALERAGARPGVVVRIGEVDLEWR
jgi:Obg family GTPase CgtA-like protein